MNRNEVEIREANISYASSIGQLKNKLFSDETIMPQEIILKEAAQKGMNWNEV